MRFSEFRTKLLERVPENRHNLWTEEQDALVFRSGKGRLHYERGHYVIDSQSRAISDLRHLAFMLHHFVDQELNNHDQLELEIRGHGGFALRFLSHVEMVGDRNLVIIRRS